MDHCISNEHVNILFDETGDINTFFRNIDTVIASGVKALLLFSADENHFDEKQINQKLTTVSVPVCGGIFPQIIYQDTAYQKGAIVCGLYLDIQVDHIQHLSATNVDFFEQLESTNQKLKQTKNMMLLVDGNTPDLSRLMENLYNYFGDSVTYFGGGAGTLRLVPMPCLYSNEGLLADAAQIIGITENIAVAVNHGWEKFAGPFVITESNHNVIQMIDYHPAFAHYKKVIEENTEHRFDRENFFDISKQYPFGLEKLNGSIIVRDPIKASNNELICVAEVPQNSITYILNGTEDKLIEAAKIAAEKIHHANAQMPVILFNCISLSLVLGDKHSHELKMIAEHLPKNACLMGVSSIGEIANTAGFLEFYNKTVVIASFQE